MSGFTVEQSTANLSQQMVAAPKIASLSDL
jgi:hypothetical protein